MNSVYSYEVSFGSTSSLDVTAFIIVSKGLFDDVVQTANDGGLNHRWSELYLFVLVLT